MLPVLTPAYAQGCLELIAIVAEIRISDNNVSQLNLGHVEPRKILHLASSLKWLEQNSNTILSLSKRGLRCLGLKSKTDQLAMLLGDYIRVCNSPWVQLIQHGRKDVH